MTYAEILDEVRLLCRRADIDDKIAAAIRTTTLRAHRLDFFPRDRLEAQITWTVASQLVAVPIATYLTRYRAVDYMRYYNPDTAALGNLLEKIDPRDVLDEYNYEKLDKYYQAGSTLKIRFEYPTKGIQLGYFSSPLVHPAASFVSWIADELPDLLIQGALAQIYNQTGKQEEARSINQMVGFEVDAAGRSATKGQTLVEQLRQFALEESAR